MSDITVHASKNTYSPSVTARYLLGSENQTEKFSVVENGDYWFVTQVQPVKLTQVDFIQTGDGGIEAAGWRKIPMLLNGVPLTDGQQEATLFPGRYRVTGNHPFVVIDQSITVGAPSSDTDRVDLAPQLSGTGRERIAAAARARLDACLAQHTFATSCGFGLPGLTADPSTISWSKSGSTGLPEPEKEIPEWYTYPGMQKAGLADVVVPIEIDLTCTWVNEAGQPESAELWSPPNYYVADVTDPDHIVIDFGYQGLG